MKSWQASQTKRNCSLDIGILLTLALLPYRGKVCRMGIAAQMDAGILDLSRAKLLTEVVEGARLEGAPVQSYSSPEFVVGFPTGIIPHYN